MNALRKLLHDCDDASTRITRRFVYSWAGNYDPDANGDGKGEEVAFDTGITDIYSPFPAPAFPNLRFEVRPALYNEFKGTTDGALAGSNPYKALLDERPGPWLLRWSRAGRIESAIGAPSYEREVYSVAQDGARVFVARRASDAAIEIVAMDRPAFAASADD